MTIYLSLPISGKCETKQRQIAKKFQFHLEKSGHEVINPFDLSDHLKNIHIAQNKRQPTYEEFMQEDLCNLDFCTHILLCEGWESSKGCIKEVERAMENNIKFLFESYFLS